MQGVPGVPGSVGPTGPCCTGPTGPGLTSPLAISGRLTVDADCNLVLYAAEGIASMTAVQILPDGTRGWRVTTEPLTFEQASAVNFTFGHTFFLDPATDIESPPVQMIALDPAVTPTDDGRFQASVTFALQAPSIGIYLDPCCGTNFFAEFPFIGAVSGNADFVAGNLPSPCPPPAPLADPQRRARDAKLASRARTSPR